MSIFREMACNAIKNCLKIIFMSFFTIWSAGAFRSLQNLTGTKSYHSPFRIKARFIFLDLRLYWDIAKQRISKNSGKQALGSVQKQLVSSLIISAQSSI